MSTWEERMAIRARSRLQKPLGAPAGDPMAPWREPGDPEGVLPQILAARCLGIAYGDPGPELPAGACRECWGDRYIWMGNTWGQSHRAAVPGQGGLFGCSHSCHDGEVLTGTAS